MEYVVVVKLLYGFLFVTEQKSITRDYIIITASSTVLIAL